jgi:hypothetical protein
MPWHDYMTTCNSKHSTVILIAKWTGGVNSFHGLEAYNFMTTTTESVYLTPCVSTIVVFEFLSWTEYHTNFSTFYGFSYELE